MIIHKVCPVIVREIGARKEILVFRHPNGDIQIVKGTVESNESFESAALRELNEESGIANVSSIESNGIWESGYDHQIWHFYLCQVEESLAENWTHFANDDGGLYFNFFWFDIDEEPTDEWHPIFQDALKYIKTNFF
jgi:8-oxo-dGTP pyrophosphatase MutT (NUDIX family)